MANVHVFDHPLIQHKLAVLRSKETPVKEFRELISEISGLMCYEATRNLPTVEVEVETPVATAKCRMLSGKKLAIVPILRAGLGMVDAMVDLIPFPEGARLQEYHYDEHHRLPRGHPGRHQGPPGCGHLPGRLRREAQRPRLHCPRPGRRRRPDLWYQVIKTACPDWASRFPYCFRLRRNAAQFSTTVTTISTPAAKVTAPTVSIAAATSSIYNK